MDSQNVNSTSCKAVISREFISAIWHHWHETGGSYTREHVSVAQLLQFTIFLGECSQKLARISLPSV